MVLVLVLGPAPQFRTLIETSGNGGTKWTPPHHHRTLAFCTPVVDTGGGLDTPLGLSCHTHPLYTAGGGAPDTTAAALADTLPVSWTGGGDSGDVETTGRVYIV